MLTKYGMGLLACMGLVIYASDEAIHRKDWQQVKEAVFKKNGKEFEAQFNKTYPKPSEAGVKALADQLDELDDEGGVYEYNLWLEAEPVHKLAIYIDATRYSVYEGRMADIILRHKGYK